MNRDDWLYVGCKLLGIYFGVQGIVNGALYGCFVIEEIARGIQSMSPFRESVLPIDLYRLTHPLVYLVLAFLLTYRTEWCLRLFTPQRDNESA